MSVRRIDGLGDWTFGQGRNNYLTGNAEVMQSIRTRLGSFLGDCFFDLGAGIDWFNLLGGKDQTALQLAIAATILKTKDVTRLLGLTVALDRASRNLTVQYRVETSFSTTAGTFTTSVG